MGYGFYGYGFRPYVPVGLRLERARRAMEKRRRRGLPVTPVVVRGREIARTFWGASWCRNLEEYGDFANRLPRGRRYLRNGSVVDLQVAPGRVDAFVAGSELYTVAIQVSRLPARTWASIRQDCVGGIDSLVALLRGELGAAVMERVCRQGAGLFPSPREIRFRCSCPDYATLCKHVAAALYGVGARLDEEPELLFRLREVSAGDLVAAAPSSVVAAGRRGPQGRILGSSEAAAVFGVDLVGAQTSPPPRPDAASSTPGTAKPSARTTASKGHGAPKRKGRKRAAARPETPAPPASRPSGPRRAKLDAAPPSAAPRARGRVRRKGAAAAPAAAPPSLADGGAPDDAPAGR